MEQSRAKTCPRCKVPFECGLSHGEETCWCFDFPRVLAVVEGAACLCPKCLKAEIAGKESQSSQSRPIEKLDQ